MGQPHGEQRGDVERADQVVRDDLAALRDASLRNELAALQREFTAGLNTAGVQIGAVEKTVVEKIKSLKAWGIAALVGGQTLAGLIAAYGPPRPVSNAVAAAVRLVT
jgi:hypothetical protein